MNDSQNYSNSSNGPEGRGKAIEMECDVSTEFVLAVTISDASAPWHIGLEFAPLVSSGGYRPTATFVLPQPDWAGEDRLEKAGRALDRLTYVMEQLPPIGEGAEGGPRDEIFEFGSLSATADALLWVDAILSAAAHTEHIIGREFGPIAGAVGRRTLMQAGPIAGDNVARAVAIMVRNLLPVVLENGRGIGEPAREVTTFLLPQLPAIPACLKQTQG